ncbi:DUF3987 domain-containing protein [Variovorax saccharolyticus]|uniref:DUF3987 domain-containing protein n=1 Tax=Variovorax saccharolyticus TaxID=3053516 RepID=UPI002575DD85|nr:DUF3987 domain-containing protein [Variovorax sp. J22R187]MDM0018183.1 DUF3987 domain-containing protein [Variovorax sp. J22R187]
MSEQDKNIKLVVNNEIQDELSAEQQIKVGNIVDPRFRLDGAPVYKYGQLPKKVENYIKNCIASWGGDSGAYVCAVPAVFSSLLSNTVLTQTNPLAPNKWRIVNDFTCSVGDTGVKKSGVFKDMTLFQREWDEIISRNKTEETKDHPTVAFLQTASLEAMLDQLEDNKGEPLMIGCDEAFMFYDGAGAHHQDKGNDMMSHMVCSLHDGVRFRKRLRTKMYDIANLRGSLVMATTLDNFRGWKALPKMITSGMMGRHTFGLITRNNFKNRDTSGLLPSAERELRELFNTIRSLKNYRFVLAEDAHKAWFRYEEMREAATAELAIDGKKGLAAWCGKYETRVLTIAQLFQVCEYIEAGKKDHVSEPIEAGKGAMIEIRTVQISRANLKRAIDLHEGFLYDTQEFFYNAVSAESEFGEEIINLYSRLVANKMTSISRDDLAGSKGPNCLRGAITQDLIEKRKRYVRIVMAHGAVEPDHEGGRSFKNPRADDECANYVIPPEFHLKFSSEADQRWFGEHYAKLSARLDKNFKRRVLTLDDDDDV